MSPTGDDHNAGTYSPPFRTLAHAQAVVRSLNQNMSHNITVYLKNGTYRLSEPLQMGPQDSGTNGHNVIWKSASGENAIISGAERVSGWKVSDKSKNIWWRMFPRAWLPGRSTSTACEQPSPPTGSGKADKDEQGIQSLILSHVALAQPERDRLCVHREVGLMVEPRCPVASIKGSNITMAEPCWDNSNKRLNNLVGFGTLGAPTYIENAYELLNQPGQFYLDQKAHTLYYIPRAGQNMHNADVEAPVLQSLVTGSGSGGNPSTTLTSLTCSSHTEPGCSPVPPMGSPTCSRTTPLPERTATIPRVLCQFAPHGTCPYGSWTKEPGNVQFSYDHNLSFNDDRFVHLGAAGLSLDNAPRTQTSTARCSPTSPVTELRLEMLTCLKRLVLHRPPALM